MVHTGTCTGVSDNRCFRTPRNLLESEGRCALPYLSIWPIFDSSSGLLVLAFWPPSPDPSGMSMMEAVRLPRPAPDTRRTSYTVLCPIQQSALLIRRGSHTSETLVQMTPSHGCRRAQIFWRVPAWPLAPLARTTEPSPLPPVWQRGCAPIPISKPTADVATGKMRCVRWRCP